MWSWWAIVIATFLVVFVIIVLIVVFIYISISIAISEFKSDLYNQFMASRAEFCKNLQPPTFRNIEVLGNPRFDGYDQELAFALVDICTATSNFNCDISSITTPPTLNNYMLMIADGILFGAIYYNDDVAVIAFSGTSTLPQWGVDFQFKQISYLGVGVHEGFAVVYNKVCKPIVDKYLNENSPSSVYITGHSLGGALSTLCALDTWGRINGTNVQGIHYSYASPRVGNPEFALLYNNIVTTGIRINNTEDIIPQLPPAVFMGLQYEHVRGNVPFTVHYDTVGKNHNNAYINNLPSCPLVVDCEDTS